MPQILQGLDARYVAGRMYRLMSPFEVISDVPGVGRFLVPEGFITDFHSTPRAMWGIFPPDDWAEAAVAHDWLFYRGEGSLGPISVWTANKVHREMLIAVGCPKARAEAMYLGLTAGGWVSWRRYRQWEKEGKTWEDIRKVTRGR